MTNKIKELLDSYPKPLAAIGSPSDSFEITLDILGKSTESKILGEFVYFQSKEKDADKDVDIVSLGQITEVMTSNKWHEEPSFKAVIKRHGSLPHLSKDADNRIATLNVQSTFKVISESEVKAHKLSNSPSTGMKISGMTNEIMDALIGPLCANYKTEVLGRAYDTDVRIPFWFKHFGKDNNGAGDAYHIGVFGKTGSGKTTTAARMIAGYATNNSYMSFLILDPQGQFFNDNEVIPNASFKEELIKRGIKPENYHPILIPDNIALPPSESLFVELLKTCGFLGGFFSIKTEEKLDLMAESVESYLENRKSKDPTFNFFQLSGFDLLKAIVVKFSEHESPSEIKDKCSKYISHVYAKTQQRTNLLNHLEDIVSAFENGNTHYYKNEINLFSSILNLFKSSNNQNIDLMVDKLLSEPGHVYILNLLPQLNVSVRNDNFQAKLIDVILSTVISKAEKMSLTKNKANCLIVLDEAHRFINSSTSDDRLKELNKKIIDSVRTVRKYGIGHMFITQTIESIDQEVIQQMRIFGFGFGLTMGTEFSKIKQIINDDNAAKFYRSFIDPSSNGKYPFMFHGPISPLSFTGSPLFIEMN